MSGFTQIQAFTSPHVSSPDLNYCLPCWPTGDINVVSLTDPPQQQSRFGFKSGVEASYGPIANVVPTSTGVVDSAGVSYFPISLSNFTGVTSFKPDMTQKATFGTPDGFDNQPDSIPRPGLMAITTVGGVQWIITQSDNNSIAGGTVVAALKVAADGTITFGGSSFAQPGGKGGLCVASGSNLTGGTVYSVAVPNIFFPIQQLLLYTTDISAAAADYDPTTWTTPNAGIVTTLAATLLATAVDAAWTQITCEGIAFDESDGTIIILASNAGAVGYFVKIKPSDGSVVWKTAFDNPAPGSSMMGNGRIKHGTFYYLAQGSKTQIYTIDTKDGTAKSNTTGLSGVSVTGAQCSDDVNNCIVVRVSFTKGFGSPVPLNETPDSFSGWAAIYPAPGGVTSIAVRYFKTGA